MNKRSDRNSEASKIRHRTECQSHYQRNKQYYRERNNRIRRAKRQWLIEYKEQRGCQDCEKKYRYYQLDFDHRDPSLKETEVGNLVNSGWKRLKDEVVKCDVVCANCHRERSYSALSSNGKDTSL